MAIQLIQFPKSDSASDDRPAQLTFSNESLGTAGAIVFVLFIVGATSSLWAPWYSSTVVRLASGLEDPGRRDFAYGVAWYVRHLDTIFVLLAITNAIACAGFVISTIRIHEVVTEEFFRPWAHLDGGVLDVIARVACLFGGGPGGACGLLAVSSRYGYVYRYSRSATVIVGIVLNFLAFWFLTGLIGAAVSRPNYDPLQQDVRPSARERIDVNHYMGMYLAGRSPYKASDNPELINEIAQLTPEELEELKQTEEQLEREFNAQSPFLQMIMKESAVSRNPAIAYKLGDLELEQMDDLFQSQERRERAYEAGGGYFGYEQRHTAEAKEYSNDNGR